MNNLSPFHLAIPVNDLNHTAEFYEEILQCKRGRFSDQWIDYDFFGHQLVLHMKHTADNTENVDSNPVDGHDVPIPHFGVVLKWDDWHQLADRLKEHHIDFVIEPYIRFKGKIGEQATMFFKDPSNNALEFKAFKDISQLFAS